MAGTEQDWIQIQGIVTSHEYPLTWLATQGSLSFLICSFVKGFIREKKVDCVLGDNGRNI
jgi:hypothetical protein